MGFSETDDDTGDVFEDKMTVSADLAICPSLSVTSCSWTKFLAMFRGNVERPTEQLDSFYYSLFS